MAEFPQEKRWHAVRAETRHAALKALATAATSSAPASAGCRAARALAALHVRPGQGFQTTTTHKATCTQRQRSACTFILPQRASAIIVEQRHLHVTATILLRCVACWRPGLRSARGALASCRIAPASLSRFWRSDSFRRPAPLPHRGLLGRAPCLMHQHGCTKRHLSQQPAFRRVALSCMLYWQRANRRRVALAAHP